MRLTGDRKREHAEDGHGGEQHRPAGSTTELQKKKTSSTLWYLSYPIKLSFWGRNTSYLAFTRTALTTQASGRRLKTFQANNLPLVDFMTQLKLNQSTEATLVSWVHIWVQQLWGYSRLYYLGFSRGKTSKKGQENKLRLRQQAAAP